MPLDQAVDLSDHQAATLDADSAKKKKRPFFEISIIVILTALSLMGFYALTWYGYPLFHSIIEVVSIVIAIAIFAVSWNTKRFAENKYFKFIGIAFLFIATFNVLHMLAYKGMGVFTTFPGANLATQLWIAMRYMLAFTFITALVFTRRKLKPGALISGYVIATGLLLASIFYWQNFPVAYDNTASMLTPFKVASEYVISLLFVGAIILLYKIRQEFSADIYRLLFAAMVLVIATEMAFTLYTDVYGIANLLGHLLNVVSFYLIYKALVETNLNKPYNLLFRNLKQNENNLKTRADELTQVNQRLKEEMAQREATEEALRDSEERLQLKLDSVLSPDVELGEQEIVNIIDVPSLQATMNHLFDVTKMGFALVDLKGNVLVGTGWQEICTKFHRVNKETCRNCIESDIELTNGLNKGEVRLYKCKNNMWDVVTPLFIGDKHVGNIFFGQFFFDDEVPDRKLFAAQAEKYGFNKKQYLDAFERIPRFSRKTIEDLMTFYARLSEMISRISYSNLKLAKLLESQKKLQGKLEEKANEVQEYATQMGQLAEERARKLKDSERLSAIGATAGMVGHDIRNPLQSLVMELYMQKKTIKKLTDDASKKALLENVNNIENNVQYINKIVSDLQDFAKPLSPKTEQMNVAKVIQESMTMVTIPENIELSIVTSENLASLTADSTMIKRVLVNLTQNAVQAMQDGGKLTIQASKTQGEIEIVVQDTGQGIPKDIQPKLFTPLMTTKAKGQGFGLAVVRRMTEAMGGTVTFESEEGVGTKFILKFPA